MKRIKTFNWQIRHDLNESIYASYHTQMILFSFYIITSNNYCILEIIQNSYSYRPFAIIKCFKDYGNKSAQTIEIK